MRNHIRNSLIFIFLLTAASLTSYAQGPLGQILARMDAHNKALKTMQANVTMLKFNSQLNDADAPIIGTTKYISKLQGGGKMYVRVDWQRPVEESVAVIGDDYQLYRPRLQQMIVGRVDKAKNNAAVGGALSFMSMSRDQLKANYDVTYLGEEQIKGGIGTIHLLLNPKAAGSYKSAELWVDGDGMPRQAKVTEANNDTTTVLLENIVKNPQLKGGDFKITPSGPFKTIKN